VFSWVESDGGMALLASVSVSVKTDVPEGVFPLQPVPV
jgi:hypothetical protein